MAKARAESTTRSGRFRDDANIEIIKTEGGDSSYRVLNAGDHPFTVVASGGGNPVVSTVLQPECSVDIHVAGARTVEIQPATGQRAEGSYELIDTGAVRGGRFKSDAAGTRTIVLNEPGLYRVINGGTASLTIGSLNVTEDCSVDFFATAQVDVVSGNAFEGAYDALNHGGDNRSGRFKFTAAAGDPKVIIDVSASTVNKPQRYRIINAGKASISVKKFSGGSWANHASIKRFCAVDVQVSPSSIQKIGVTGGAGNLVLGSVEYLGPVR